MEKYQKTIGSHSISFYESCGTGEPACLLIHGNSCCAESFSRQLDSDLGRTHRLVAFDFPGHGQSPPPSAPQALYSMHGYSELVANIVAALDLSAPVLVGHSLGGHIAIEATPLIPALSGIFVFGTPPLSSVADLSDAFLPGGSISVSFKEHLTGEDIDTFSSGYYDNTGISAPEPIRNWIRTTFPQSRSYLGQSAMTEGISNECAILDSLRFPAAVLHPENDSTVNAAYMRRVSRDTFWRGGIVFVPDAGHWFHHCKPELFNSLLETFLEELSVGKEAREG